MKKFIPIFSFLILSTLSFPMLSMAAEGPFGLIVCDGVENKCDFSDLIVLFKNGVNALIAIATVITVIALIFMGVKLMTSGGNPAALTEVKKRAKMIIVGYVVILSAWLIVYTILKVLVDDKYILLGKPQ